MEFWKKFPNPDQLDVNANDLKTNHLPLINGHLHTPYSFSAFKSIDQAISLASQEGIRMAGINDFNTVKGFKDWGDACWSHGIAPLFNIEMIGLNTDDQANHIKVNDPSNPGRTYISGKGLAYGNLPQEVNEWLETAVTKNNAHSQQMTLLANRHLKANGAPFTLDYREIYEQLTLGQVRERHLARAIRLKTENAFPETSKQQQFYKKITGKEIAVTDPATVENTLRGALLKAGGPAYIPESSESFAGIETIRELILKAKGIPTYPFLGDALNQTCTDFEKDLDTTIRLLRERGFYAAEFITTRNSLKYLEDTAQKLWDSGLLVTFGTEHNTPAMEPIVPMAKGATKLSETLQSINYQSACIILAHQYLNAKTGEGWLDPVSGTPKLEQKDKFIKIGQAILNLGLSNL
ncbi:PHP domain-containing protein [Thermophagus sp. OGC60D27]|uniref:PHP domain-containing protein n=1 Tax=Thermophagus sp. OGC60D27 TaxID=3458415 RepID=UPI004037925F